MFVKMLAGGLAGPAGWTYSYPLDKVKTIIQCTDGCVKTSAVIARIYRSHGIRGFYQGFSATLMYSFQANSLRLPMFDYLNFKFCGGGPKRDSAQKSD